jgi:hypothetical protein
VAASACVVCSVILPALLFILDQHIFRLSTAWLCDIVFGYCCKSSRSAEGENAHHCSINASSETDLVAYSVHAYDLVTTETNLIKEHGLW